jgi:flagellar biosynthesis GTPase FlhF
MWCVNCHNFFDWNTLKIIEKTQYTHNPEHLAWVAKNSQTLGNVEAPTGVNVCNIEYNHITNLPIAEEAQQFLRETLRTCNEIQDNLAHYLDPLEKNIEKHAIDFLKSKITKDDLKKLVQRNYKSSKKTELANMHRTMYADAVKNTIVYSVNKIRKLKNKDKDNNQEKIETILQNTFTVLNNLRDYTEKNLETLGNLFNSEKPRLSNSSNSFAEREFNPKWIATSILKTLRKLREAKFQLTYYERHYLNLLTNTNNEGELIKFLRTNPDWVPREEELFAIITEEHNQRRRRMY